MNEKTIFVRRGQVLTVESLRDGVTGEGFFLVKNEEGEAVRASEVRTAEGVVFTADESKRLLPTEGLEYHVYLSVINHLATGKEWGINKDGSPELGEVKYILFKDLKTILNFNLKLGEKREIKVKTISNICNYLGFRSIRTGRGYGIVVEKQDLQAAKARFAPLAGQETRTVYKYEDGLWREEWEESQAIRKGIEGPIETREIPLLDPLPN